MRPISIIVSPNEKNPRWAPVFTGDVVDGETDFLNRESYVIRPAIVELPSGV